MPCARAAARRRPTRAARAGRPLDLVELGPSGGLNLLLDRYHFRYGEGEWGASDSALALAGRERGRVPAGLLGTPLEVRGRIGIDRQPVDVASEHGALLLQAFVWADEPERLERVRRAIAMARRAPPELLAGDYLELLPELLSRRRADGLTVVFSSNSTEYLDDASYGRLAEAIEAAGRRAPLAWVSAEPPRERRASGYVLELQLWPGGERRRLARVHYHGAWIDWIA